MSAIDDRDNVVRSVLRRQSAFRRGVSVATLVVIVGCLAVDLLRGGQAFWSLLWIGVMWLAVAIAIEVIQ